MHIEQGTKGGTALQIDIGSGEHHAVPDPMALQRLRQEALAANFHHRVNPYVEGEHKGVTLRPHQPDVFSELDTIFVSTAQWLGRSILMPLPPNAGKNAMAALAADMAGIGQEIAGDPVGLKGLALVPRRFGVGQMLREYHRFAPDAPASAYRPSRERQESVDQFYDPTSLKVATYGAIRHMPEELLRGVAMRTSLLVLDEVHRALGPQILERITKFIEIGRPTVLAMSATPDFNETRTAVRLLGIEHTITPISPREAVKMGISNGVQLFALYTGEEVGFKSKRESITEQDIQGLMDNPRRNDLILDVLEGEIALGKQGIVQCIPGGNNRHAQEIARLAQERGLKVKAVGQGFQADAETVAALREFKQGELQALTFTRYLTESFDHPLGFIIFGSPSGSLVDTGQTTGRGARFHAGLTAMYALIDKYHSTRASKRLWTPFDIFGEECLQQGVVITSSNRPQRNGDNQAGPKKRAKGQGKASGQRAEKPLGPEHFSDAVRQALDGIPAGTTLDELLLVRVEYDEPPPGYVPLVELPAVQEGLITAEGARYILAIRASSDGRPLFVNTKTGKYKQHVLPLEADQAIRKRCADPAAITYPRLAIDAFLVANGWPRPSFDGFRHACKEAGAETSVVKTATGKRPEVIMTPGALRKFLEYLAATPLTDPLVEVTVADLARALGHTSNSHLQKVIQSEPEYLRHVRKRRKGLPRDAYRLIDVISVEGAQAVVSDALESSMKLRLRLGSVSAASLVEQVQERAQAAFWRRKLHSRLSQEAIDSFLSVAEPSEPPPQPAYLDDSYIISDWGELWPDYGACNDLPRSLFFTDSQVAIAAAKKACSVCEVKGDCLLSGLRQSSDGIWGGFTVQERQAMGKDAVRWLQLSRQHGGKQ